MKIRNLFDMLPKTENGIMHCIFCFEHLTDDGYPVYTVTDSSGQSMCGWFILKNEMLIPLEKAQGLKIIMPEKPFSL